MDEPKGLEDYTHTHTYNNRIVKPNVFSIIGQ